MIIVYTVKHSGTHSLLEKLGLLLGDPLKGHAWQQYHCTNQTAGYLKQGLWNPDDPNSGVERIHTTYRDPYKVAITWANRYVLDKPD